MPRKKGNRLDTDQGRSEVLGVIKPLVDSLHLGKWIGSCAILDVPGHGHICMDEKLLFSPPGL